jgi:hypothetical protein
MRRLVSSAQQVASRDVHGLKIGTVVGAVLWAGIGSGVARANEATLDNIPSPNRYFQDQRQEIGAVSTRLDLDAGNWRSQFGTFHLPKIVNAEASLLASRRPEEKPLSLADLEGKPVIVALAQVGAAPASNPDDLLARLDAVDKKLQDIGEVELNPVDLVMPGVTSNVPNAYGASKGIAAIGIGYQNRTRYTDSNDDGAAALVVGLSDPRSLGVDLQVTELDLSQPGHDIALGFKLHRQLNPDYSVALGGEEAKVWGKSDSKASYYGVVTRRFRLKESSREAFSRLYLSAGVGTGRFRSEADVANDTGHVGVFGSAAINVYQSSNVFAEWNGQSVDIGTSIVPFHKWPLVVTLAAADVAGGGGDGTRYTVGVGYVIAR